MPRDPQTHRTWRDVFIGWLNRLPLAQHPIEPELPAETFARSDSNEPAHSPRANGRQESPKAAGGRRRVA
jgi:hypothetical protein